MRINLKQLFLSIGNPTFVIDEKTLLDLACEKNNQQIEKDDIDFVTNYFSVMFNATKLEETKFQETPRQLYELSANAFHYIIMAWISELPIEREIIAYGRGILSAAQDFNNLADKRREAEKAANNRANADTLTVLNTANKVLVEDHRLKGILRFTVNEDGEYIARCEPDHFTLPCLGDFFTARFGDTPWAIIDEKRGLALSRKSVGQARINVLKEGLAENCAVAKSDEWEELWKHYHKTINNEDRKNLDLQKRFMPKRYWKYLPEM